MIEHNENSAMESENSTDVSLVIEPDLRPFPLFKLPPELRNWIYRHVADCSSPPAPTPAGRPTIAVAPFPALQHQLVSRQYKREYEEEVLRFACVLITTTGDLDIDIRSRLADTRLAHSGLAARVQSVTVAWEIVRAVVGEGIGFSGVIELIKKQLLVILPIFSALRMLRLTLCGYSVDLEQSIQQGRFTVSDFFGVDVASWRDQTTAQINFGIERNLLIRPRQWAVYEAGNVIVGAILQFGAQNNILYRGIPTSDPNAWHGLELQTASAGIFDYDGEVAAYRARLDQALEAMMHREGADSPDPRAVHTESDHEN
ncbi:hypothetical protein LTR36_004046 [Oleoguttula mirabilis]|uniref:Uncharacterized protein n=1 Tax=Oleoguttula mirabilis TaxID=1507867 RepID=A0AAV9JHJ7_9PEZI|nr:hypothetical protein LTR36_004046 [Oleoguttula mirabilis]